MSDEQQEKWKGMFGRLRNCRGNKKRLSVKAPNGSLEPTEPIRDEDIGQLSATEVKSWGDAFFVANTAKKTFSFGWPAKISKKNAALKWSKKKHG